MTEQQLLNLRGRILAAAQVNSGLRLSAREVQTLRELLSTKGQSDGEA